MFIHFPQIGLGKYSYIILFSFLYPLSSQAQTCQTIINPAVTAFTNGLSEVAQSVTMTDCPDGNFTSFTVYSNTPHTNARLRILNGDGTSGSLRHIETNITINLDITNGTTVSLPAGFDFIGGETYTFLLDFTGGGSWQLHKSTLNLYDEGSLYEEGIQIADEDLRFQVQTDVNLLPVELTQFNATTDGKKNSLFWQTASEQNNEGFEIEHSADGKNWEMIGFVPGQGTTSQRNDYFYEDDSPLGGTNYYRLRQIDFDGNFDYSVVRSVYIDNDSSDAFGFYPNPIPAGRSVTLTDLGKSITGVRIIDFLGSLVLEKQIVEESDILELKLPEQMVSGVYLLCAISDQKQTVKKLIVE